MREAITDIERELMLISRHAAMAMLRSGRDQGRLERSAYLLLRRLQVEGPMSIGQLAEAFGLDTSTVNRQTAALLRAGLAERIPDPHGGMARKLRITADGLRRLEEERNRTLSGLQVLLADWTEEELDTFARGLTHFNASIELREGCPWPRREEPDQALSP